MKVFLSPAVFASLLAAQIPSLVPRAQAAELPVLSSPFAELRKAPLFQADRLPLARTWGPALPVGTEFQVEKVYGRWVFGKAQPLANMKAADQAPSGWLFSRHLLVPGDSDTAYPTQVKTARSVLYHSGEARPKLFGKDAPSFPPDFLETLTLSQKTLAAFSLPENPKAASFPSLVPEALASEKDKPAPLGLSGTELSFLEQEISVIKAKKQAEKRARERKKLKVPSPPPLDSAAKVGMLGRYMFERYLDLPPLSMEEVDGYIYLKATAQRALNGCPVAVQDHWKKRRWNFFRIFRLKSRPEQKHPWFELALPGGYFGVSARSIALAGDEAELAFLVVRQLVREHHLASRRKAPTFNMKAWPRSLTPLSEEFWEAYLQDQSTKEAKGIDVSDEITVDMKAIECISRAGYRPMAAVAYLKKLLINKDQSWAEWYAKNSIGLEYRTNRVTELAQEAVAQHKFPEGKESMEKRFASAARQWNLMP